MPGVKLHCSVGEYEPDDPRLDLLWRRVSASGHPVVVHAGHAVNGTATAMEIEALGRVTHRWPDARIIVAHCGTPAVAATLALLRSTRSVYADLTPVTPMLAPITRTTIAGLERRLLFGSDAPNGAVSIEEAAVRWRMVMRVLPSGAPRTAPRRPRLKSYSSFISSSSWALPASLGLILQRGAIGRERFPDNLPYGVEGGTPLDVLE